MNSHEEPEDSPLVGRVQDDSGYHTNTPLSCEHVHYNESVSACQSSIPPNTDKQATPVGAITKFERMPYHSFKKLKCVLTTKVSSRKQGNLVKDYTTALATGDLFRNAITGSLEPTGEPTLHDYRKRLHSMPNLFVIGENGKENLANGKQHLNRASKRLLSIGANEDSLLYQGWINLNSNKSGLLMMEKIDFIEKLGRERNLMEIAVQILKYLKPDDLMAASKVATFWKQAIASNKILYLKLQNCNLEKKIELYTKVANKENTGTGVAGSFGRRGSCADIKNIGMDARGRGGQLALEVAPIKDKFAQMARQNGTWLCFCPKCSYPAQVEDCQVIARCLQAECNYYFCSKCLFKPHYGKECSAVGQNTPTKLTIGGKKSKKNLRRL